MNDKSDVEDSSILHSTPFSSVTRQLCIWRSSHMHKPLRALHAIGHRCYKAKQVARTGVKIKFKSASRKIHEDFATFDPKHIEKDVNTEISLFPLWK